MIKKILKYGILAIFLTFLSIFIWFYFFVVQSFQIVITQNGLTEKYYSYRQVVKEDINNKNQKTVRIYLNHQKFWDIQYWNNFPKARAFSSITLKFDDEKLIEAETIITDLTKGGEFGQSGAKIPLEGKLVIDGNFLKDVNLRSISTQDNIQINYYIRKINLNESDIALEY